mmetsp:Transcript_12780/g.46752  ORF Transcript_12780/g.46752 Transcript_12780/m.46752 type:complete len:422 (+) Transcript_12780:190-1455(+)
MDDEIQSLVNINPSAPTVDDFALSGEASGFTAVTPTCTDFVTPTSPSAQDLGTAVSPSPWELLALSPSYRNQDRRTCEGERGDHLAMSAAEPAQDTREDRPSASRVCLEELIARALLQEQQQLPSGAEVSFSYGQRKLSASTGETNAHPSSSGSGRRRRRTSRSAVSATKESSLATIHKPTRCKGKAKAAKSKGKEDGMAPSVLDQIRSQVLEKLPYKNRANKRYGAVSHSKRHQRAPEVDVRASCGHAPGASSANSSSSKKSVSTNSMEDNHALSATNVELNTAAAAAVAAAAAATLHANFHAAVHQMRGSKQVDDIGGGYQSMAPKLLMSHTPRHQGYCDCSYAPASVTQMKPESAAGADSSLARVDIPDRVDIKCQPTVLEEAKAAAICAFPYLKRPPTTCMDSNTMRSADLGTSLDS